MIAGSRRGRPARHGSAGASSGAGVVLGTRGWGDEAIESVGAFVLGTVVGSFLGVCIHRIPRGESVVRPRSHCPRCGSTLGPLELAPVLGWLAVRGRCRHCGESVPVFYPAIELGAGVVFALVVLRQGVSASSAACLVLASLAIVAAGVDLQRGVIPDSLTIPWLIVGVASGALTGAAGVASRLLGIVACGGTAFLIALVSRGGMGGGDVKMMALVGSFLGPWGGLAAFVLASVVGALVGIVLVAVGARSRKDEIPFGPFIATGAICVCIWGESAIRLVFPWL